MAAVMRQFLSNPMTGEEVERASFERIDRYDVRGGLDDDQWAVARRMVHTCADPSILRPLRFRGDWKERGLEALAGGCTVYCDSNMIRSGLSRQRLERTGWNGEILCHVADPDVAAASRETGLPRSIHAVRKAGRRLDGGIALFGNAPLGLAELCRLVVEEGIRPALVVAFPVGFVHVRESKAEFLGMDLPGIALQGLRGGSPLAVAALHALCGLKKGSD